MVDKKYFARLVDESCEATSSVCIVHDIIGETAKIQHICKRELSHGEDTYSLLYATHKIEVSLRKVRTPLTAIELWEYLREALYTRTSEARHLNLPDLSGILSIISSYNVKPSDNPFDVYEFALETNSRILKLPSSETTIFVDGRPYNPGDWGYYDDERGR